jgi:hypothetical protein
MIGGGLYFFNFQSIFWRKVLIDTSKFLKKGRVKIRELS